MGVIRTIKSYERPPEIRGWPFAELEQLVTG